MAIFANVSDGTVCSVIDTSSSATYNEGLLRRLNGFVECGADVRVGWIYDGSGFSAPPIDSLKAAKREEIASARWEMQNGGCEFGGMQILTDGPSQIALSGAYLAAAADPNYTCKWKTPDGFVELTSDEIIAAANAVRAHIQGCFDMEAVLAGKIDAAETAEEVAAVSW